MRYDVNVHCAVEAGSVEDAFMKVAHGEYKLRGIDIYENPEREKAPGRMFVARNVDNGGDDL